MNTLRGVFPEPPPIPRRNFIKENMIHIKRMQGFVVNDAGDHISYKKQNKQIENDATQRTMKLYRSTKKQIQNLSQLSNAEKPKPISVPPTTTRKVNIDNFSTKTAVESLRELEREKRKFREIGVQTDNNRLFHETGTVKYATTPKSPEVKVIKSPSPRNIGDGDRNKQRSESPSGIDESREKKDYVKENAQMSTKSANSRLNTTSDPTKPPPTYQKGVVPKYLRDRKEELIKQHQTIGGDERCPEGHVVLPENERKETLRMLRQSYSELVSELNQLPVRSDTLKIRNRKIEIENQLKKLDEGIKVFTRPKVYVKIGA